MPPPVTGEPEEVLYPCRKFSLSDQPASVQETLAAIRARAAERVSGWVPDLRRWDECDTCRQDLY